MSIGYACLAIAVPGSGMKSCRISNATEQNILALIEHNLCSLENLIDYNAQNGIKLFRISSDLIPFGSSLAMEIPWQDIYSKKLERIGSKIREANMRVSMHPGQYTVLNSTDKSVVERAIQDLNYHTSVFDSLGLGPEHKLVLHLGGAYGDKSQAKDRFILHYGELENTVRSRLILENDDKLFNIGDVLETSYNIGIPVVFDNLHNKVNPIDKNISDHEWIGLCSNTWKEIDGPQKIHYSQQSTGKKSGAHSGSIDIDTFLDFYNGLPETEIDIMLEVKDKNLSALKCINCVSDRGIRMLEDEWARYKYFVLERSQEIYNRIRVLLRDKSEYKALDMYRIIETACDLPVKAGSAINAAQHVWGYFKGKATENEKRRFERLLARLNPDDGSIKSIKNTLLQLAIKHKQYYLLEGYYLYK